MGDNKITISEDEFGFTKNPLTMETELVKRFTFSNDNGLSIQVITYGATITSIKTPDNRGQIDDIVLGFDNMQGYLSPTNPYFGATIGRVCNRINKGEFYLNGKEYRLARNNNGRHHLHGGNVGFDKFNWNAFRRDNKVIMSHVSPDNYEGYPGLVLAFVTFELQNDNKFDVRFSATTSKPTIVNLTNHSYFNLGGHGSGYKELYEHVFTLNADKITAVNADSIPTGELTGVGRTPFDLRTPRQLELALIDLSDIGFDHNYYVIRSKEQGLAFVGQVVHPKSGRILEIYSDQPAVQFYVGNYLPDPKNDIYPAGKAILQEAPNNAKVPISGKNEAKYYKHGAFCLETQNYPDAINHSNFPNVILNPGEIYSHHVVYKFDTDTVISTVTL